jgi:hypothetical protein
MGWLAARRGRASDGRELAAHRVPEGGADGRAVAEEPELGAGEPGDPLTALAPEREPDPLGLARDRGGGAGGEVPLERAEVAVNPEGALPLRGERAR